MRVLYIAPVDERRSGIARYAWAFAAAMKRFGGMQIDALSDVIDGMIPGHTLADVRAVRRNVQRLIDSGRLNLYDCIHVELGSDLYPEFFYAYYLTQSIQRPLVLTLHDAPFTVKSLCPYWDWGRSSHLSIRLIRKVWNVSIGRIYEQSLLRRSVLVQTLSRRALTEVRSRFPYLNPTFLPHIALDEQVPQRSCYWDGARRLRLLFLGFVYPVKGVHLLLEAVATLAALPQYRDRFELVVCGGFNTTYSRNEYVQRLKQYVSQRELRDIVTFTGFVPEDEVVRHLSESDVLILPYLPSRIVSASGPLIRGMTFGDVPIVTDVRAFAEEVENGRTGFVVPPNNVQAIVKRIQQLIDSPRLVAEMSQNAQEHIRREHSWAVIASQMRTLYEQACRSNRDQWLYE